MASTEHGVLERERVVSERRLPVFGEVLVHEGEAVQPASVIARAEQVPGDPYTVDVQPPGRRLPPEELERCIRALIGEAVAEGDVLAHLPGQDVRSPVSGRVEFISRQRGYILIREDPSSAQPVLVVDAARQLDVWPGMLPMYMERHEGEFVPRGGVLAVAPAAHGSLTRVLAPAAGTLERIDSHTGYVYLVRQVRTREVHAFLQGRVAAVLPQEGAVVEADATVLRCAYGVGGERFGELLCLGEGDLDAGAVGQEARGKVLAVPGRVGREALARARSVEVAGIIAGCCGGGDLAALLGHEPGTVTGQEDLPFSMLLTEGFGNLAMDEVVWGVLQSQAGRTISVSGATQIRSGGRRPRAILFAEAPPLRRGGSLAHGARVRVLRGRHHGAGGTVVELPEAARAFASGAVLPAALIDLGAAAGQVWLPRANLEVWHGDA